MAKSTILITGGHSGLGLACTQALAATWGADIILAGRSPDQMQAAAKGLRAQGSQVETLALDVGSLASVRAAAAEIRQWVAGGKIGALRAIICNAGAQFYGAPSFSPEGYESTFAVNYLGHFLLVNLLLDQMADDGRVVLVASGTHDPETTDGRMVGGTAEPDARSLAAEGKGAQRASSPGRRYATAKLCTILFAYELDRRLRRSASGLSAIAFDPGWIAETGLVRQAPQAVRWLSRTALVRGLMRRAGVTMGSLGFSGAALAQMAADPAYAHSSGKYIQSNSGRVIEPRSSKVSYDEARAAKLWQDSEELAHIQPSERPGRLAAAQENSPSDTILSRG